jgi:diguanylate cyclase (GGDEF)-like protein/PAS domain S-box-containing protein
MVPTMVSPGPALGAGTAWVESLFERSPIGQGVVDLRGRWVRVNPALARILGRPAHDVVGRPPIEFTHPDDLAVSGASAGRLLAGEADDDQLDTRYVRPDGSVVWCRLTTALVRDPLGRPHYAVAQVEDVTAERARRRFTDAVLDNAATLIVVFDRAGRIVRFNGACERVSGWSAAEVLGRAYWDVLIPRPGRDRSRELFRHLLEHGDDDDVAPSYDGPWVTRDGGLVVIRWTGALLRDEAGAVTHMLGTGLDVTEQRAAEQELCRSERRHRAIVEGSSDLVVVLDADMRLVYASGAAERLLGKSSDAILGSEALSHVHPDDVELAASELLEAMASDTPGAPTPLRLLHADGSAVAVEALASNRLDDDAVAGVIVTLRDVREREDLDRRFRSAFGAAPIGMAIVGIDGMYLDVNRAMCEIVGYDADELLLMRFQDITHPDDVETGRELHARLLAGTMTSYRIEKRYVRADGDLVWAQLSLTLVRDDGGDPAYFISQIEDITERRAATDGLAHQAHHDSLTGLLNRHATLRRVEQALARRHVGGVAVLFVDLDGFKQVNDTYGHAVGDHVLRTVASRASASLRPTDAAGRLGGDEFVVVLEGADEDRARTVADRLARSVARPICLPASWTDWVQVDASIGVAVATSDDGDAADLVARADRAMYARKRLASSGA